MSCEGNPEPNGKGGSHFVEQQAFLSNILDFNEFDVFWVIITKNYKVFVLGFFY